MIANLLTGDLKSKLIVGGAVAAGLYLLMNRQKSSKPKTNGLNGTGTRKRKKTTSRTSAKTPVKKRKAATMKI